MSHEVLTGMDTRYQTRCVGVRLLSALMSLALLFRFNGSSRGSPLLVRKWPLSQLILGAPVPPPYRALL